MNRFEVYQAHVLAVWLGEVAVLCAKPVDQQLVVGLTSILADILGRDLIAVTWDEATYHLLLVLKHRATLEYVREAWDGVVDSLEELNAGPE